MGIFDLFRREQKQSIVQPLKAFSIRLNSKVSWTDRNSPADYARDGYQRNVIVYQGINLIATLVASVPVRTVDQSGDEVEDSPFKLLWDRPNPQQSSEEYLTQTVGFLKLAGNAYQEKVKGTGEPKELYSLRPDRVKVVVPATGEVQAYEYTVSGKKALIPAEDIQHIRLFNPLDDWYGQSPLMASSRDIDQHEAARKWIQGLLQNSARPSGALVVDREDGSVLPQEAFDRLKNQVEEQYTGADNAGKPLILEGGLNWKPMGLSPKDMGDSPIKDTAARDISLSLGIPPMLLGIPGDNTYSNYKEARAAFWEDTVMPITKRIVEEHNEFLSDDFGGHKLEPNFDDTPAIVEKKQVLWEMAEKSTDLTINERRELKGYPPLDGEEGDKLPQRVAPAPPGANPQGVAEEAAKAALYKLTFG